MLENTAQFLREVKLELSKVTWPQWKPVSPKTELWASTIVVFIAVALLAAFIGIIDRLLTIILSVVLGR